MKAEQYILMLEKVSHKNDTYYGGYEKCLWGIFHKYIEDVRYSIEEGDVDYFHKGFRQVDIINAPLMDSLVYVMLGESKWSLWLLEFMRNWDKEREVNEYDIFAAMLDWNKNND